ncbi:MAG: DUF1622 domain-containing protein [Ruminococcaceae bacterium]|nr:DUF1622 domain-containing protein [Oscillospiraceae bacterium]
MEFAENILQLTAQWSILLFEAIAAVILILASVSAAINYFTHKPHTVLTFARKLNVVLSFKLAAEIMRLTVTRTFSEIAIVGCIIVIHGAISFLIHWEIKREEESRAADANYHDLEDDINL